SDNTSLTYKPLKLNAQINFLKNNKSMYLTNLSQVHFNVHQTSDIISSLGLDVSEKLKQRYLFLENNFSYIPYTKGSNIVKLDWNTFYKNIPEDNRLDSDTVLPILADYSSLLSLNQSLNQKNFKTELNLNY